MLLTHAAPDVVFLHVPASAREKRVFPGVFASFRSCRLMLEVKLSEFYLLGQLRAETLAEVIRRWHMKCGAARGAGSTANTVLLEKSKLLLPRASSKFDRNLMMKQIELNTGERQAQ